MRKSVFSLAAVLLTAALVTSFATAGDKHGKGHAKGVKVGDQAPAFSLQDQNGNTVNLSDFGDKVVVLEWWNDGCPVCAAHYKNGSMQKTAAKIKEMGGVWIAVNSTAGKSNDHNKTVAGKWNMDFPILNDASGEIGHAYGAKTTPHMYVIHQGKIAYMGAIDDNANNDKSNPTNYVIKAVEELNAGQSVSNPETKPYGCSVKYAH
jgi:peroxiredoxin